MRLLRALAFVTVGILVGVGVTVGGQNLKAAQRPTSSRLVAGGIEWAGNYPFRFFMDTKTGQCYLAGLSGSESSTTITAITKTDSALACPQ